MLISMKDKLKVCKKCSVCIIINRGNTQTFICSGNYGPGKTRGLMEESSTATCTIGINEYYLADKNDPKKPYKLIKEEEC